MVVILKGSFAGISRSWNDEAMVLEVTEKKIKEEIRRLFFFGEGFLWLLKNGYVGNFEGIYCQTREPPKGDRNGFLNGGVVIPLRFP